MGPQSPDIALIATSPNNLATLLSIAQTDSTLRGWFSPAKCIVVSPTLTIQPLYGAPLYLESHFNYLGVELVHLFRHLGGPPNRQLNRQVREIAGTRYLGFRLFKAFLRPFLEYGLTSPKQLFSLKSLETAQKAAISRILALHRNSHNTAILEMANCETLTVRQSRLRFKRLHFKFFKLNDQAQFETD